MKIFSHKMVNALFFSVTSSLLFSNSFALTINPSPDGWKDSYSVGDKCYCDTSFDHGIGEYTYDTPAGTKTVREICAAIGPGPGVGNNPKYNTVQCGNPPGHDYTITIDGEQVADEQACPGRTDQGPSGCSVIGPKWDLSVFSSTAEPLPTQTTNDLNVPGKIEAEEYTAQSGTQNESTTDDNGGVNVGYIENGDYLSYTVNASKTGTYELRLRIATPRDNTVIDVSLDGNSLGTIDVPNTNGWQNWTTVKKTLDLTQGEKTIRLDFSGSNSSLINLNWLNFVFTDKENGSAETIVVMQKVNTDFAIDGNNNESNEGKAVYLYATNRSNVNQQWIETSPSSGYYSFRKVNTSLCLDAGDGADYGQAVTLQKCDSSNLNQHFSKKTTPNSTFRLEKRDSDFSIDGNNNGENFQDIYLWKSSDTNVNQQWKFLSAQ